MGLAWMGPHATGKLVISSGTILETPEGYRFCAYLRSPLSSIRRLVIYANNLVKIYSGIITPNGLPHAETVEELPVKDPLTKKFRLKVIPKRQETEFFHAVFVFDGEKAPSMSVASLSKDVSIVAHQKWKSILIPDFDTNKYI